MAPEVAAGVQNAMDRGQLVVRAGRPRAAHPVAAGFVFEFRPKGANGTEKLLVDRIINCSGPQTNYGALDDPLFQNLPGRGLARPAALEDRKGVGQGKRVSVRVDLGGRRIHTKKNTNKQK